jgi:hypothetical protein
MLAETVRVRIQADERWPAGVITVLAPTSRAPLDRDGAHHAARAPATSEVSTRALRAARQQSRGSYDPLGGPLPPVATKLTQPPWLLNCGSSRQPPFLH